MATQPTITNLDPAVVAQNEQFLVTFIQEQYPSMDLSEGRVLRNLLIRPAAQFYALNNLNIQLMQESQSILAIEANPLLADPALVDAVLSNYRITRNPGAAATGQITIVIQNLLTTQVSRGTVFTANGIDYINTQTYIGVTTQAAVVSDQQRLIVARNDGLYAFTIPVTATAVGTTANAKRGTGFTVSPTIAGLIDAFATADFSGGLNAQTNQDLINLFKLALSPQVFSGRANITSLLVQAFPSLQATSIIGFGDEEMLRDRDNLFGVSTGGKADIYARTAAVPVGLTLTKTATLIDVAAQLWQFSLSRDDAPGFYTVDQVLPLNAGPDQGSYVITSETRGLDLTSTDDTFVPQISNLTEGAYSRYQTAVVQFYTPDIDTTGMTANVTTRDFQVVVRAMPYISDMQAMAVDRGNRNPSADYLVRAPIPAFTTIAVAVLYTGNALVPDVAAIKQAVFNRVSGLNFTMGQLPSSVVYQAVMDVVDKAGVLVQAPIDMQCSIRKPDGSYIYTRSGDSIIIPEMPADEVTSRTTIFYVGLNDITVTVSKVPVLPV